MAATVPAPPRVIRSDITDAEACSTLSRIVRDVQPELPKMIDAATRLDGVSVVCALRTHANNKFILVPLASFRDGWQARKQAQWNDIVCRNEAFRPLQKRGWRFVQNLTFVSGERFSLDAKCN